jgi:hypothetical protein
MKVEKKFSAFCAIIEQLMVTQSAIFASHAQRIVFHNMGK